MHSYIQLMHLIRELCIRQKLVFFSSINLMTKKSGKQKTFAAVA